MSEVNNGAKLKYWMNKRCLRVEDLQRETGLSKGHIISLRNNRRKGSIDVWEKISRSLNVTLDDLRDKQ